MANKKQKNIDRQQRKEKILSAAIELIEEKGFETTTMDDIAEKADISKGTLYLYFNDKAALHQSIKKRALGTLHEKFQQIFHEDITGAEVVRKMAFVFLDFVLENTTFNRAMMLFEQSNGDETADSKLSDDCMTLEHEVFILMVRALQIGIQDKSIRTNLSPKVLGLHLAFEMRGILQYYTAGKKGIVPVILDEQDTTIHDVLDQFIQTQFNISTDNFAG
jgi:AcrR family transcriptional regulator